MPSLNDSRKVIKVTIPGIEGGEVELWDDLTVGDAEKIQSVDNNYSRGIQTLFCLIKSWNLEEDVTIENIKLLNAEAFSFLINETTFGKNAKKSIEELEEETQEKKTL